MGKKNKIKEIKKTPVYKTLAERLGIQTPAGKDYLANLLKKQKKGK